MLGARAFSTLAKPFCFVLATVLCAPLSAQTFAPTISDKLSVVYEGTCTPDQKACAYFTPTEVPVHAVARHLKSARKSIRIATYNMDVLEYLDVLSDKLDRGVKIEFGVDYKLSYQTNVIWKRLKPHPNLTRFRLPVFRGGNPQMHNKIIVIDDQVVLFGSANFTYSGLVANYENILAIRDAEVIGRFNAEFDELKAHAFSACRLFAQNPAECGQGTERWNAHVDTFLKTGKFPPEIVGSSSQCTKLVNGLGLLDEQNLPRFDFAGCITDQSLRAKLVELVKTIAAREKYVDGSPTDSADSRKKRHSQGGLYEVYFSPEDDVQRVILRELNRALENPKKSFALVSTNFITNRALAMKLVEMHRAGVRLEVFFDRGRIEDPDFQMQVELLKEIGLVVFDNTLTGPYGSNHNKMAVIGVAGQLTLLNGSANWSSSAMTRNDENLLVSRDSALIAIYAREILSQLYVYRNAQNHGDPGFKELYGYLVNNVTCLRALLIQSSCVTREGHKWSPKALSPAVLSLDGAPVDSKEEQVWVWIRQLEETHGIKAVPLFTHHVFAGRWLTSVPVPPNWKIQFKFFKAPKGWDPNTQGIPASGWEYPDSRGPDRSLTVAPFSAHVIRQIYKWGTP
jgi:phospholipase D